MHGLPFQDLLPGLLVVLVVNFNDIAHIVSSEVIITPAPAAAKTKQESQKPTQNFYITLTLMPNN